MFEKWLRLPIQFFAAEGGEEGSPEGGNPEGNESTPAGTEPKGESGNESKNPENNSKPEKTFTQDDVNNLIAREVKKAQEKLLKQLGVEDFNSAKDGLAKFKEWQESQKTEAQKQAERLQELETNYNTVLQEKENLAAQLSAVKAGVNAEYVSDVIVLAQKYLDEDTTIDDAIVKVLDKYPHFKGVNQEPEPKDEGPKFSSGKHNKEPESELDAWLNAFKN